MLSMASFTKHGRCHYAEAGTGHLAGHDGAFLGQMTTAYASYTSGLLLSAEPLLTTAVLCGSTGSRLTQSNVQLGHIMESTLQGWKSDSSHFLPPALAEEVIFSVASVFLFVLCRMNRSTYGPKICHTHQLSTSM